MRECREQAWVQAQAALADHLRAKRGSKRRLEFNVGRGKNGGRRTDLGNLVHQLKAVIDGIADAGWLDGDGPDALVGLFVAQFRTDRFQGVEIWVTIEE
jgi:hypothetical protein